MKCKILHLPTGTFLYRLIWDEKDNNFDPDYLYSEFEISTSSSYSNIFPNKTIARNYINNWHKHGLVTPECDGFVWDELGTEGQLRREHCDIIEVKNV
jgi:hypothetical protein